MNPGALSTLDTQKGMGNISTQTKQESTIGIFFQFSDMMGHESQLNKYSRTCLMIKL